MNSCTTSNSDKRPFKPISYGLVDRTCWFFPHQGWLTATSSLPVRAATDFCVVITDTEAEIRIVMARQ